MPLTKRTYGIWRNIWTLLCATLVLGVCASASFGQSSVEEYDLFTSISGARGAKLSRVAQNERSICKFDLTGAQRVPELKYAESRVAAVRSALEKAEDPQALVDARNDDGQTALHYALYSSIGPVLVELLLDSGADPNAPLFNQPPLWHALSYHNDFSTSNCLELLDYGADPNALSAEGEPVLFNAVKLGNFWVAQRLLELGADPEATYKGQKPIDVAIDKNLKALLTFWSQKNYPYSPYIPGRPLLHRAAAQNNYWMCKRLLENGADPDELFKGKKASYFTTSPRVKELLLSVEKDADSSTKSKNVANVFFSDLRVMHVYFGEYEKTNRHRGGAHSYASYLYMKRANLKPQTHALYQNGVQVCSVERRSSQRSADDPNNPSHTFFPTTWSKGDIIEALNQIAFSGANKAKEAESTRLEENYKGVRVVVILRVNSRKEIEIVTGYPIFSRQPTRDGKELERLDQAQANIGSN